MRILLLALYSILAVQIAAAQSAAPSKPTATPETSKVKPLEGEGLLAFYERNGLLTKAQREAFVEMNKGRFTRTGDLLSGVYYRVPPVSKDQIPLKQSPADPIFPIFGKEYERVVVESDELKGATFYLCSGHGGPDPGAIATYAGHQLCEDEYAYDVVLRLGRELIKRGAKVHIIIRDKMDGIRDDAFLNPSADETCGDRKIPLSQIKRLQQRCEVINDIDRKDPAKYKRAIFIHLDSRAASKRIDIFLYHLAGSATGHEMADAIRDRLELKYNQHQPGRGFSGNVTARDLFVLKQTNMPAIFLELGNLQNPQDAVRFIKPNNRAAMAKWIAEGIAADYAKQKAKQKAQKK